MTVINTNVGALQARTYAMAAGENMQKAMERLSSGLRINSAADDAAGLAVANKMESQLRGMNVAIRNSQDGISLVQTAEAGMSEISNMVIRMRELAVQMNNGVYTASDRENAQLEISALLAEVNKIAENTAFNDVKVLNGTYSADIRAGNTNVEVITVAIDSMRTDSLAATAPISVSNEASGTSENYTTTTSSATVSVTEGFRVNIAATTPSASGTALEKFANLTDYSGGTYALKDSDGNAVSGWTIDTSTGSIISSAQVDFDAVTAANNKKEFVREYSANGVTFKENITLNISQDTSKTLNRSATSTILVGKSDTLTINAVDPADVSGGAITYTSNTVSQGSLSAELAAFIDVAGNANGTFALTGTDAADFDLDTATGQITLKSSNNFTASASLTLTYTAENGDAFVETIVLTQDAYSASGDSQALSLNMGDSGDITFDVTSNSFVSDDFLAAVAAATGKGETVTYAIANSSNPAAIANTTTSATTYTIAQSDASTADHFEVVATFSGGGSFTETVTLTVADTTTASAVTAKTFDVSSDYTASATETTLPMTAQSGADGSIDLSSSSTSVSNEFLKALARAGAGGNLNVTSASTSLNGGVTGELGSGVTSINVDGGTVTAADQIVIQVRDASDVVLHTETIIAGVITGGTPFAIGTVAVEDKSTRTHTAATTALAIDLAAGKNLTFDLTSTEFVTQSLIDAAARITADADADTVAYKLSSAVNNINGNITSISGTSFVINSSAVDANDFVIEVFNGSDVYHTETVGITVTNVNATTSAASSDTASIANIATTLANAGGTTSAVGDAGVDSSNSVSVGTSDSTNGPSARAETALAVVEANSVEVKLAALSSEIGTYVAANTGGTFSLTGADKDLFTIGTDGNVTSKAGVDFEKPTDAGKNNTYNFEVNYTKGNDSFKEIVTLSVTNFVGDDGDTLKDVNLATQNGAATAVTILDTALNQISSSQAKLGAIQNRLQHNIDNLSMASMLTETARGRIVDADFARETSELSKQQILNQAATSMLAQANQSKQSVLALLQ